MICRIIGSGRGIAGMAASTRAGTPSRSPASGVTPSFGAANQGAGRLWGLQDMGGLVPYGGVPYDMGGQLAADLGYGMAGPGGRGAATPYAGLTQSPMGYRAVRYGWRWEVGRFNLGLESARQDGFGGFGGFGQPLGVGTHRRVGGAQHSAQVRGGVSF